MAKAAGGSEEESGEEGVAMEEELPEVGAGRNCSRLPDTLV